METLEALRSARALIAKGWTQKTSARDVNGVAVHSLSTSAVCFCAVGALYRATGGSDSATEMAANRLRAEAGVEQISHWNDTAKQTQSEVLARFDEAIRRLESEKQ